jgi:DNA-directed RNA polymerase specialized sigma24 family protein
MVPRRSGDYRLTPDQQAAWELSQQGLTHREIARRLGVAPSNVAKRLRRARLLLETARIAAHHQKESPP